MIGEQATCCWMDADGTLCGAPVFCEDLCESHQRLPRSTNLYLAGKVDAAPRRRRYRGSRLYERVGNELAGCWEDGLEVRELVITEYTVRDAEQFARGSHDAALVRRVVEVAARAAVRQQLTGPGKHRSLTFRVVLDLEQLQGNALRRLQASQDPGWFLPHVSPRDVPELAGSGVQLLAYLLADGSRTDDPGERLFVKRRFVGTRNLRSQQGRWVSVDNAASRNRRIPNSPVRPRGPGAFRHLNPRKLSMLLYVMEMQRQITPNVFAELALMARQPVEEPLSDASAIERFLATQGVVFPGSASRMVGERPLSWIAHRYSRRLLTDFLSGRERSIRERHVDRYKLPLR